jgi:hypothetical protein
MNKTEAILSESLENLQQAHHLIANVVQAIPLCGSFALLSPEVSVVLDKLCALTEIAAALMDAKMQGDP